jgi:hypothetical protein
MYRWQHHGYGSSVILRYHSVITVLAYSYGSSVILRYHSVITVLAYSLVVLLFCVIILLLLC